MRQLKTLLTIFCSLIFALQVMAIENTNLEAQAISARLVADGFENVRVICIDNHRVVATIEDNHYHGIYHGVAQALRLIADGQETQHIDLIVMQDRMPRINVKAVYQHGQWNVLNVSYANDLPTKLRNIKAEAPSSYKADFVLYPGYGLINDRYDRIWSAHFAINPALEMHLWKGSHLLLQAHIPVWDNYSHAENYSYNNKLGITRAVLSQKLYMDQHWDITASAGLFTNRRAGIDVKGIYHINTSLDLGIKMGETAPWSQSSGKLKIGQWNRFNILGYANYYESHTNLQIELHAGQFLFEDKGARMDVYRHFADYTVGLYGTATNYGTSIGFSFSAPVGPRLMGRHRAVRLRAPEALSYSFDDNTNIKDGHQSSQLGKQYSVDPNDQIRSVNYWQPEFLRKYILKDLRNELK